MFPKKLNTLKHLMIKYQQHVYGFLYSFKRQLQSFVILYRRNIPNLYQSSPDWSNRQMN